jgi:hypothetical protein
MTTVDPPAAAVAATAVRMFRDWSALPDPPQRRWRILASRYGLPEFSVDVLRRHKILLPLLQIVTARDDTAPEVWARELTRQRRRAAVLMDELRTVGRRLDAPRACPSSLLSRRLAARSQRYRRAAARHLDAG